MASASRAEQAPAPGTGRSRPAAIFAFPERAPGPAALARVLEQAVIPRLLAGCRSGGPTTIGEQPVRAGRSAVSAAIRQTEVSHFAQAAITEDVDLLFARLDALRLRGFTDEALCLELLTPAARLLGFLWEEDLCSFNDVTVGLFRFQQLLQRMSDRAPTGPDSDRTALFATVPGEQHTFGVLMAADAFRREGWRVVVETDANAAGLARLAATESFDLIGLSVCNDRDPAEVSALIARLRATSLNPGVKMMVGGRFFDTNPHLVAMVGADGGAEDAAASVRRAESIVGQSFARP